jgi:hypothetical protein
VEDDTPTTEELRAVQRDREASERDAEQGAPTEAAQRAHRRRADKAAYLEQRLAEQERALEEAEE